MALSGNTIEITSSVPNRFEFNFNGNRMFVVQDLQFEELGNTLRITGTSILDKRPFRCELTPGEGVTITYNGVQHVETPDKLRDRLIGKVVGTVDMADYYTKAEINALLANLIQA